MGSRVRNLRILEALSDDFQLWIVTLVHDRSQLADPGPVPELGRWVAVPASQLRAAPDQVLWHARARWAGLTGGIHRETYFMSLPPLAQAVRRLLREVRPDIVHSAYWFTLRHLRDFPRPPLWIVDTHDVQFERHRRLMGGVSDREQSVELRELARYDRIVAITQRDRETFLESLPAGSPPVEVIGMGLDFEQWRPEAVVPALPYAPRVTFYGNLSTETNRRGALHLLHDIVPELRRRCPGVEVLILGTDPGPEIAEAAAAAGAELRGFVADIRPFLRSSSVLALSIHAGSGQRGRVVEALALALPVVGYRPALDGLEFREGEGILPVDTPEELCRGLGDLLLDPERAAALGRAGQARVRECYGLDSTYRKFPALYRDLLETEKGPSTPVHTGPARGGTPVVSRPAGPGA